MADFHKGAAVFQSREDLGDFHRNILGDGAFDKIDRVQCAKARVVEPLEELSNVLVACPRPSQEDDEKSQFQRKEVCRV